MHYKRSVYAKSGLMTNASLRHHPAETKEVAETAQKTHCCQTA